LEFLFFPVVDASARGFVATQRAAAGMSQGELKEAATSSTIGPKVKDRNNGQPTKEK